MYNLRYIASLRHGGPPVSYRGLLLILAAFAAAPWLPGVSGARNVALLVAVGQFRDPELKEHELLGTAADIDSMQQTLTQRWGFAAGDVVALRNQDATHERILAEISSLEKRSAPGDTVLIYFSGHGTSANDADSSFDLPYATGAWIPYDIDMNTPASAQGTLIIGRRDLVPRLKKLDQGGRLVVVISDSCYSGQVVRSFGQRQRDRRRYLHRATTAAGAHPGRQVSRRLYRRSPAVAGRPTLVERQAADR
jgi:Caspase domain